MNVGKQIVLGEIKHIYCNLRNQLKERRQRKKKLMLQMMMMSGSVKRVK